ncbi:hypothetical protein ACIQUW_33070 [Streptomyces sp. NPDC101117]|uniref:hypothetical protein n=1 Tax=Streptomyces sp. NPDC101117 TaxID=3366108 RepID=UPI0038233652
MAIATLTPTDDDPASHADELVTFDEAALLFQQIGRPEFDGRLSVVKRKLQRWADQDGLATVRRGRALMVSFSDLLEAHARRHPGPTR